MTSDSGIFIQAHICTLFSSLLSIYSIALLLQEMPFRHLVMVRTLVFGNPNPRFSPLHSSRASLAGLKTETTMHWMHWRMWPKWISMATPCITSAGLCRWSCKKEFQCLDTGFRCKRPIRNKWDHTENKKSRERIGDKNHCLIVDNIKKKNHPVAFI